MTTLTHKEMTAHIRACIKRYGIKARVVMQNVCGDKVISVVTPTYESKFTSKEIYNFCMAANTNGLTFVKGLEVVPSEQAKLTGKNQWNFTFQ